MRKYIWVSYQFAWAEFGIHRLLLPMYQNFYKKMEVPLCNVIEAHFESARYCGIC